MINKLNCRLFFSVADVSGNLIADWRRFDAVAKVIASCPKMSSSTEEYYKLVSPQVYIHQEFLINYTYKITFYTMLQS